MRVRCECVVVFFLAYIFCFCWFVWNWSFDIKGMINIYLDSKKKSNQFDSGVDDRSSPCMCTTATTSTNLKRLEIINNWFWNYGVIFSNWLYCVCTNEIFFTNDRSSLTFFFFFEIFVWHEKLFNRFFKNDNSYILLMIRCTVIVPIIITIIVLNLKKVKKKREKLKCRFFMFISFYIHIIDAYIGFGLNLEQMRKKQKQNEVGLWLCVCVFFFFVIRCFYYLVWIFILILFSFAIVSILS